MAGIAAVVFAFCYALAGLVLAVAVAIARRPAAALAMKATVPVMLTPLSLIAGLVIVFLAARVWANLDQANTLIAQEAGAAREALLLSDALPSEVGAALRDAVHT